MLLVRCFKTHDEADAHRLLLDNPDDYGVLSMANIEGEEVIRLYSVVKNSILEQLMEDK